jgi:hypothetical protein
MNIIKKAALGLAMLAGATALTTSAADARVTVGIGIGGGYYGHGPAVCDPYSRWYDPYRCDRYDDYYGDDYYYGSPTIYFGGYGGRGWHGGYHGGGYHGGFGHGGGFGGHGGGFGGHGGGHGGGHHH